jgi:hypothetical protein
MKMEHGWNDTGKEKPKYPEKDLSQCTSSAINPTWTGLGLNQDLHGGRLVTQPKHSPSKSFQMWQTSYTWVQEQQINISFNEEIRNRLNSENGCYHWL